MPQEKDEDLRWEQSMTQEELANLKRGDLVRNVGSGESYMILDTYLRPIAVRSVTVTNPQEWEKVDIGKTSPI